MNNNTPFIIPPPPPSLVSGIPGNSNLPPVPKPGFPVPPPPPNAFHQVPPPPGPPPLLMPNPAGNMPPLPAQPFLGTNPAGNMPPPPAQPFQGTNPNNNPQPLQVPRLAGNFPNNNLPPPPLPQVLGQVPNNHYQQPHLGPSNPSIVIQQLNPNPGGLISIGRQVPSPYPQGTLPQAPLINPPNINQTIGVPNQFPPQYVGVQYSQIPNNTSFNNQIPPLNPQGNFYQPPQNIVNPMFPNFNISGVSIPIQSQIRPPEKTITISCDTLQIIINNNLLTNIERSYGVRISKKSYNSVGISGDRQESIDNAENELKNLIKTYSFDDNARWCFLENDGSYKLYQEEVNRILENSYRDVYSLLLQEDYKNYSRSVQLSIGGASYLVEFARIGGVHRQRRPNTQNDTIRAVKRQANGEDLNKDFVRTYNWLWKHESGEFRPYEPDAVFLIECAYIEFKNGITTNPIVLIQGCNGHTYKLDFSKNHQFNEITNFKRQIKRVDI